MESSQGKAIPFVTFQERKGYVLTEEAEKFLNSLTETKIGVITVVGKYRTGKSFFINRVLLNQKKSGFSVGPTINPCTKGLWLWSKILKAENPEEEDMSVLLIDTEGFGGIDEHQNHDTKIFLFALLLSSFFIYNSVGSIDENALNNLSLIVNLAKDIQFKASGANPSENEDVSQYFPSFLWIIRDFALRLVDGSNNPISPKEYLENALAAQKGVSDNVESKNRIRRMLKHFFRERDCATMIRPVENEKDLQKLDEMEEDFFRAEFVEQMKNVRKKIFKKIKPKTLNGKNLTGPMLVEICKAYAEAINSGKVPNIESAWTYLCQQQSYKALNQSLNTVEEELGKAGKEVLTVEQLKELKQRLKDGVITELKKNSMGDDAEVKMLVENLNKKLREKFSQFKEDNTKKWKGIYMDLLEKKFEELEEKARRDEYSNFYEFERDFESMKEAFEKEAPAGPCKSLCFKEFSEKALIKGAEMIIKKQEQQFQNNTKRMAARLELTESQLASKGKEIEEERRELFNKIQEIEREKATTTAERQTLKAQIEEFQREKERLERRYNDLADEYKTAKEKFSKISEEELTELKNKLQKAQSEAVQGQSEYEKSMALLQQELAFTRRDNENLQRKVETLEEENRRTRIEYSESQRTAEGLRQKLSELEMAKQQEVSTLKLELERKMMDLAKESDKRKDNVKAQSEWMMEKSYLENQINFLKNQLEENKRLHDALLMALEQGLHNGESEATNELVETNRHLSAAVDKMEARCKMLEEKIEKAKRFKRMVKNSSALQCAHCSKFISTNIFLQHLSNCASGSGTHQPNTHHQQLFNGISGIPTNSGIGNFTGLNPLGSPYSTNTIAPSNHSSNFDTLSHYTQGSNASSIQISINQTMVKESSDSKPYTEYLIQVVVNGNKWSVSRKYKMFCELHQTLTSAFPSLKFPDSNFTGMSSFINISQAATSKRPTVIEERRKALQQYLRDLAKIDVIRNSQPFRKFLELDRANEPAESDKSRTLPADFNLTRDTSAGGGERQNLTPLNHQDGQMGGPGIGRMSIYSGQKFDEEEKPKADKRGLTYSPAPITTNQHYDERASNNKENRNPRKSVNDHQDMMHNKKYIDDEDETNNEQEGNGWPEANENDYAGKAFLNQYKNDNIMSSQPENVVRNNKIGTYELSKGGHSRNSSNSMIPTDQGQPGGLYGAIASTLANSRNNANTTNSRYTPESSKTLAQKNYRNLKNTAMSNSPASPQKYLFKPSMERGGTFKEYQRDNHSLNNSRNINNGSYSMKM